MFGRSAATKRQELMRLFIKKIHVSSVHDHRALTAIEISWTTRGSRMPASATPDDRQSSNSTISYGNNLSVIVSTASHRGHRVTRLNDQRPDRHQQRQSLAVPRSRPVWPVRFSTVDESPW